MQSAKDIASNLKEIATLLELQGVNPFRVRAYLNAQRIVDNLQTDIGSFVESANAGAVKGIGETLAENITTLYETGSHPFLEELRASFPDGLLELLKIPGLGAKKVRALYNELSIKNIKQLQKACEKDQLSALKGFGKKTQEKILEGIRRYETYSSQFLYRDAITQATPLLEYLKKSGLCKQLEIAGSLRRKKEVVKDIDIIATSTKPKKIMDCFVNYELVETVTGHGETKSSVVLKGGLSVDLRVVSEKEFPSALMHFTGSKEHNTELRRLAQQNDWKLSEYGLFKGEKPFALKTEAAIHAKLGLSYVPPELRENQGEVEEAIALKKKKGEFPELVCDKDIRGIIHAHTTYSDGKNTLEEMATAVKKMGYEYFGVSDHSQSASYAGGLKPAAIKRQLEEIDRLNEKLKPFRIFKGIESDILDDGRLDYSGKILEQFDFVITSIHSKFGMTEAKMTERIIRAIENPFTTIMGHPTGRLLLKREPYPVNIPAVLEAAAENGVCVEINANSLRLDLDWRFVKRAKALGIPMPINPDAHSIEQIENVHYGVAVARKGALTKKDVLTCWTRNSVDKFFEKKRG